MHDMGWASPRPRTVKFREEIGLITNETLIGLDFGGGLIQINYLEL